MMAEASARVIDELLQEIARHAEWDRVNILDALVRRRLELLWPGGSDRAPAP